MAKSLWDFEGRWHLSRVIDDHRAGAQGRFGGEALFQRDGVGLRYRETGWLTLNGARFQAERQYLWRQDGADIAVLFDDGRPFHSFAPEGAPAAAHWCDPDHYDVQYDLTAWPVWTAVWCVSGPRKSYDMTSTYTPAS